MTLTHKEPDNREYRSMEKNQSWKMQLMIAIEDAMVLARSREHFIKLMARKDYKVKWTDERKSITYTTPGGKKCRDILLYNPKFLKEMMEYEFQLREKIIGRIEGAGPTTDESGGRSGAMRYGDGQELGCDDWSSAVTNSAADGDTDSGSTADNQGGVGGIPRPEGAGVGELRNESAIVSTEFPAGDGAISRPGGEDSIITGWENERRIFEESLFGAGADEETLGRAVLDIVDPIGSAGDFGTNLAYLSADIAGMIDENYRPQDSTTMRKPRQRKRALGQKSDEQDQNHGQQM